MDLIENLKKGSQSFQSLGMDQGYCGAPAEGTAEEGHQTYEVMAEMVVEECRA